MKRILIGTTAALAALSVSALSLAKDDTVPAEKFDLSEWKITVPLDKNKDKKADDIDVKKLQKYSHPDFFYLDDNGGLVFASPNKAITTKNTSNTRSELRQMIRGTNIGCDAES